MNGNVIAGLFFATLAAIVALAMWRTVRFLPTGERRSWSWQTFTSRWGFCLMLLVMSLNAFQEAGWFPVPVELLWIALVALTGLMIAAEVVRGRELRKQAEAAKRDS